ncbi:MAG: PQQ-binding-like beta-propeller repeat protein [bacterium]
MNEKIINLAALLGTGIIGFVLLSWWLFTNPVKDFTVHNPGMDNRPETISAGAPNVDIGAFFDRLDGIPSDMKGAWPRFRGPDFDNINKEKVALADSWGENGPPILWSVDLGEGHAGPVIANGRVYVLDYDEEKRADILRCFSFEDGREIWRRGYDVYIKRNHGMSRTIPAVTDKVVVTIGPMCHVMCVDAESGDLKWGLDLEKEYGTEVPLWYTGQCPLIDDSIAVIAAGGSALMVGIHCETGKIVWETPNPMKWKMSHSSIMPFTIHGRKMYVYCAIGGIAGISTERATAGNIVFTSNVFDRNVIAPSPVHLGDGRLFVTAGYGGGSMMLGLTPENDTFTVDVLQATKPEEGLCTEQQTPIFIQGHLFSILPKDAGPLRNQFVCYHPDDCTRLVWSSGKTQRFGLGPYLVADGKFYILSDDGVLTVAKVSTKEFIPLTQAKILSGHDAWGPLALVKGRLLARDSRRLVCVDLKK